MKPEGGKDGSPKIEDFLDEPTRDLEDWQWLWAGDRPFPISSHRAGIGRLIVAFKRLLRPLVRFGGADLWERQRIFNLILLESFRQPFQQLEERNRELRIRAKHLEDRASHLEGFLGEGLEDLMRYNDALYSRVDQKLDRYRRETREITTLFSAATGGSGGVPAGERLGEAVEDWEYQELEKRFRGSLEEIRGRISYYLPLLAGRSRVLDLGCGRGEALEVFGEAGVGIRGVDISQEMVRLCREKGLEAQAGDLLDVVAGLAEASCDGIVSFHVIEHLPIQVVQRLVGLAWRALEPGGVLILETPNPLSLAMAANLFWRDPTHHRPIHPDVLRLTLELAGFDEVEIRELHPFPDDERLPEIDLDGLDEAQRELAHRVNILRDRIDETVFGHRDYAAIGVKAGR